MTGALMLGAGLIFFPICTQFNCSQALFFLCSCFAWQQALPLSRGLQFCKKAESSSSFKCELRSCFLHFIRPIGLQMPQALLLSSSSLFSCFQLGPSSIRGARSWGKSSRAQASSVACELCLIQLDLQLEHSLILSFKQTRIRWQRPLRNGENSAQFQEMDIFSADESWGWCLGSPPSTPTRKIVCLGKKLAVASTRAWGATLELDSTVKLLELTPTLEGAMMQHSRSFAQLPDWPALEDMTKHWDGKLRNESNELSQRCAAYNESLKLVEKKWGL